jgi:DNA-directed RNA polymerase subunit RPC12/RpoP
VNETPCPHCGEPVEPRQLVCLHCGGRVALRERTPLAREPLTALAAVLLVVIVVGAGLFGFAISELTSDDGTSVSRREPVPHWPDALSAHTVVLAGSSSRTGALEIAREARSSGLEAGVMPSEPYGLGSGMWLVYSGRFTSAEGAARAARELGESYPRARAEFVQSSQ